MPEVRLACHAQAPTRAHSQAALSTDAEQGRKTSGRGGDIFVARPRCLLGQSATISPPLATVHAAWLSVYPNEKEALYPPLTYLRSIKAENETIGGVTVLVATVEPVFM